MTPAQTVGPYLHIGMHWPDGPYAALTGAADAIRISGVVLDGRGDVVPDAVVETWQALPPAGGSFRAFARCETDERGEWWVVTRKPGALVPDAPQAPHLDVSVFARGLLHRVVTRIYFADEATANSADAVLTSVPEARRQTLLARGGPANYRFDVRLQGPKETVFFDL